MKLNHLHLTVDDVPAARGFLERHFGLRPLGEGHKVIAATNRVIPPVTTVYATPTVRSGRLRARWQTPVTHCASAGPDGGRRVSGPGG
jgi:catechol 2,3-dioxygenase-like lactoylglutathione lyase family enzyme